MKRVIFILLVLVSNLLSAQSSSIVDSLQEAGQTVKPISNHPVTNLERIVQVDRCIWDFDAKEFRVTFKVLVVANNQIVPSFTNLVKTSVSNSNRVNPENGQDAEATDITSVGQYDFLFALVQSETEGIIQLIHAQIAKLDQEQFFDKQP